MPQVFLNKPTKHLKRTLGTSRATGFPERLFHVSPGRLRTGLPCFLRRMPPSTRLHPEDQPPQKRVNSSPLCKR
ncbi:MAG: hypothetical protein CW342_02835 [Thermoactinomycetaceae bacterium]|nr:hypothetical protein [Bacillota bacterium]MBO2531826.1 hypothetical protein [Thermoactinomycetaceae bacterium]